MNRWFLCAAFIILALVVGCSRPEPRTVVYFFEIICPACPESGEMERLLGMTIQLGRDSEYFQTSAYDIHKSDGLDVLRQTLGRLGRETSTISFPLLVVDDEIHVGIPAVEAELIRLADR